MTPEEIGEMINAEVSKIMDDSDDDTCDHGIFYQVVGLDEETVQSLMEFISEAVSQQMFDHTVQHGGGMTPTELTRMVLGITVPQVLLFARCTFGEPDKHEDQYMRTVAAELSLGTMIEEKRDLSEVWPAEYVSEITKVFNEPHKAFLAGVICGSKHG